MTLRREWALVTAAGFAFFGIVGTFEPRSLAGSLPVWSFSSFLLFRLLSEQESALGPASLITMSRGGLVALVAGFLVKPEVAAPAYSLAALLDSVDGWVARRTRRVTELGAKLDLEIDAVGILVASAAGILLGKLPYWYFSVGLARYVFVLGLLWRVRRGKPVRDLDRSSLRRILAGCQMAFLAVALWPFVPGPKTYALSYVFGAATLSMFLLDWLYVSFRRG